MPVTVAVVGPGRGVDPQTAACARDVGNRLARAGALLVTGGLGGVMAEASRGASEAGGTVVGLLPGSEKSAANRWVDVALPTGLGEARNVLVVSAADSVIAIGGSWGTLSEVALACRLGVPVVAVDGWQVCDQTGGAPIGGPASAAGSEEAVHMALRQAGEAAGGSGRPGGRPETP